ncbi:MAG: DUF1206 domain-containing protein [Jannaschia sp.]
MSDHSWAIPVMRAGYAGRGITYLAVAGLSLWAIWRGGEAQGTSSAMETLSGSVWGLAVLWAMAAGLFAYAVWRGIDAVEDLEEYGTEAKGLVSRAGMVVTGLIHGALGGVAVSAALGGGSGGSEGSGGGVSGAVQRIMDWPGGVWIIGFAAICTLGAGIYYAIKGWKAEYRDKLMESRFTRQWDWALRAGVLAQAAIILIIGGFLAAAALGGSGSEAGGVGRVFDWLANQPFGNILVVALCIGLLGFAFFCFVNAAYRIVPKVSGGKMSSLASSLKAKVA